MKTLVVSLIVALSLSSASFAAEKNVRKISSRGGKHTCYNVFMIDYTGNVAVATLSKGEKSVTYTPQNPTQYEALQLAMIHNLDICLEAGGGFLMLPQNAEIE